MKIIGSVGDFKTYCKRRRPSKIVLSSYAQRGYSLPAIFHIEFSAPTIVATEYPNQISIISESNKISFQMVRDVEISTKKDPASDKITLHCGMYGSPEISATLLVS